MNVIKYLSKFYDVVVIESEEIEGGAIGERRIEIYEKGEDCEPIGYFVTFEDIDTFQFINIYGRVISGTAYSSKTLKMAAKTGQFY